MRTLTIDEWNAEGELRFGQDKMSWRFVCPSCGHVAATNDWKALGTNEGAVAFSCVGRWGDPKKAAEAAFRRAGGPCNYTSGGLFCINKLFVEFQDGKKIPFFDFEGAT